MQKDTKEKGHYDNNDKTYSDVLSVSGDSGCGTLSISTEPPDLSELYQDFRVSNLLQCKNQSNNTKNR